MNVPPSRPGHRLRELGAALGYQNRLGGWALVPFGVMALAQIAILLTSDDATIEWLSTLVVVAFASTTLVLTAGHWGPLSAALGAGYVVIVTLAVENVGASTGLPFGEYDYTGALQPTVGGVPLIVPVAWLAMSVPALEVGRRISLSPLGAVAAGTVALTAWDLFLDPHMVENGYWEWASDGIYHGIPLSNYVGWLFVGFLVLGTLDRIRPRDVEPDTGLVALYTWWAVTNTVGFVVFFDEALVGVVGGLGMGAVSVLAWYRWTLGPGETRVVDVG